MEEYRAEGEGVVEMRGFSSRVVDVADHVNTLATHQPHQLHQHCANAMHHSGSLIFIGWKSSQSIHKPRKKHFY